MANFPVRYYHYFITRYKFRENFIMAIDIKKKNNSKNQINFKSFFQKVFLIHQVKNGW